MSISNVSGTTSAESSSASAHAEQNKAAALISMLLGGVFIFIIGFSNTDVAHNAAHDTRHFAAFPCH